MTLRIAKAKVYRPSKCAAIVGETDVDGRTLFELQYFDGTRLLLDKEDVQELEPLEETP